MQHKQHSTLTDERKPEIYVARTNTSLRERM